jgi:hypothetical protein
MRGFCSIHHSQGNASVESRKLAAVCDSQGKEIDVGQLSGTLEMSRADQARIAEGCGIGPERVVTAFTKAREALYCISDSCSPTRIRGIGNHPHQAILSERASRPPCLAARLEPMMGCIMMDMDRIKESDKDVHVQECDHAPYSWSRSRLTSSMLTGCSPGRFGRRGTPLRVAGAAFEGRRDCRASSESTLPVEVLRNAAISFAAKRTSSSISSVVRIGKGYRITHQM